MRKKIISIHIPKTAGTSFRYTLISVYGIERIMPFYYPVKENLSYKIPGRIDVVHGHITTADYNRLIDENPSWREAVVISWVRNPVSRFISNYFYMKSIISDQLSHFKETPDLKKRMVCTLEDFTNKQGEWNETSKYINEDDLRQNKYSFIGQVENYEEDLKKLASILNWKSYCIFRNNTTKNKKEVGLETKKEIENKLSEEIELFNKIAEWNRQSTNMSKNPISYENPKILYPKKLSLRNRVVGKILSLLQKLGF